MTTSNEEKQTIQVFCSYSHEDERYQENLAKHLAGLRRQGIIELWYDKEILPGDNWSDEISENLEKSDIILLLASANFISSDYCHDIEMKRALELHESAQAIVIPILIKPFDWKITLFSHLQTLPTNSRPVSSWEQEDEAWTDVAVGIRETIESLPSIREKFKKVQTAETRGILKTQFLRLSAPTQYEIPKEILEIFLRAWPQWSFSIARIRGWGARQPGHETLSMFDADILKKALEELETNGIVVSHAGSKSGSILYRYNG